MLAAFAVLLGVSGQERRYTFAGQIFGQSRLKFEAAFHCATKLMPTVNDKILG